MSLSNVHARVCDRWDDPFEATAFFSPLNGGMQYMNASCSLTFFLHLFGSWQVEFHSGSYRQTHSCKGRDDMDEERGQ